MQDSSSWVMCGVIRFSFWMLAATAVLSGTVSVQAEIVQYQFSGVVTDDSGDLGVFGPLGSVQVGDAFTGHFSYLTGPGNPDQQMSNPELGVYNIVDFVIDQAAVTITPSVVVVRHVPGTPSLPPAPPDLGTDGFSAVGSFLAGRDMHSVSLSLAAPYQAVFADDSLPISLSLSDFTDTSIVRSIRVVGLFPEGMSQIDEGQLTSLAMVPEPSSLLLGILTAAGLS